MELEANLTVEVRNLGSRPLTIQPTTVTGTHPADFAGPSEIIMVPAGGHVFIDLSFSPTAEGLREALVHLASNAENNPDFAIPVTGIGIARLVCGDCLSPPPNYCATGTILVVYEPAGTCVDNQCQYRATSTVWRHMCDDARPMQQCNRW